MFLAPWFALAGLAAAAGPVLIHLLNRQRYRVVEWAAMDFLRKAVRRSRRILRLRDLLLLVLRTLCVLLFGLAMARPYLRTPSADVDPNQPVHAVMIIDNSLSMSYEKLDGTLLDEAKGRASEFMGRLPPGSRISVLPLCGSGSEFSISGYRTKEDAKDALMAIRSVDRSASAAAAIDLASEAFRSVPGLPAKQMILFSDQQLGNWPSQSLGPRLEQLPATLQVVQVAADEAENAWVDDFELLDGVADLGTPAVFMATIRYEGNGPRYDVQATLTVDGVAVAAESIDLQPGQSREIRFPPYDLDVATEPGRPAFVTAEVSIPNDRLAADDQRFLVVPVVSALPVVFVDQYGQDEDPQRNRLGETFRLRRLLAPLTSRSAPEQQLIRVRHVKLEQLDRETLEDARLAVIAGVSSPGDATPLLREYVEQGGHLVIAAGGQFDPSAWTEAAWSEGSGILPAPLKPTPVGRLPSEANSPLKPFQLDFSSMVHDYFFLGQTSQEELEDLYGLPYFFKAVEAELSDDVIRQMVAGEAARIQSDRSRLTDVNQRLSELDQKEIRSSLSPEEEQERDALRQALAEVSPQWFLCGDRWQIEDGASTAAALAERTRPRVLARFSNRLPFMIERDVGRGSVLFVSSGVFRDWNTLTATNAVLIFDRIFRHMLRQTLPERNIASSRQFTLPVSDEMRRARFTISDPQGGEEPVRIGALNANRHGISLGNFTNRGHYRITAHGAVDDQQAAAKLWEIPLAVNGPADESRLAALDEDGLSERMKDASYRWVSKGQTIALAGAPIQGQDFWRWLMLAVLAGLLIELIVLAWPSLIGRRTS